MAEIRTENDAIGFDNTQASDAKRFREGLLFLLAKVNVDFCDDEQRKNIKIIYELLAQLEKGLLIDATNILLWLLQEELKSRKFFTLMCDAGLGDTYYQVDLGDAILLLFGFESVAEEVADFYDDVIEKHSSRLEANGESLMQNTLMAYAELAGVFGSGFRGLRMGRIEAVYQR